MDQLHSSYPIRDIGERQEMGKRCIAQSQAFLNKTFNAIRPHYPYSISKACLCWFYSHEAIKIIFIMCARKSFYRELCINSKISYDIKL